LQEAAKFGQQGMPPDWLATIKELYDLRNSVAHSGRLRPSVTPKNMSEYIFATNGLFAYCREQRAQAGVQDYSYPSPRKPYDQLVAFKDAEMYFQTSESTAPKR
jgi:hypothetical protein